MRRLFFAFALSSLPLLWSLAGQSTQTCPASSSPAANMEPFVETIPGTEVRFEMVPIPGGTFVMGSPASERERSGDEGPNHPVTIRPFWMGKTEITWDEYGLFAFAQDVKKKQRAGVDLTQQPENERAADAVTRPTPAYADETFGFGREGRPAINITHHAAMEYCRWLSLTMGKLYRLPTEAEWEYACRAGAKTAYHFGDDPAKLDEYAWYLNNADAQPHPVGKKKPSPWGLHDMHGNVAEWCLDRYDESYYRSFDPNVPAISPVLVPGKERFPHVVRGGSWDDEPSRLRCAARRASTVEWSAQDPQRPQSIWWHTDAIFVGFRVVRPLEEQENLKGLQSQVKKYD